MLPNSQGRLRHRDSSRQYTSPTRLPVPCATKRFENLTPTPKQLRSQRSDVRHPRPESPRESSRAGTPELLSPKARSGACSQSKLLGRATHKCDELMVGGAHRFAKGTISARTKARISSRYRQLKYRYSPTRGGVFPKGGLSNVMCWRSDHTAPSSQPSSHSP